MQCGELLTTGTTSSHLWVCDIREGSGDLVHVLAAPREDTHHDKGCTLVAHLSYVHLDGLAHVATLVESTGSDLAVPVATVLAPAKLQPLLCTIALASKTQTDTGPRVMCLHPQTLSGMDSGMHMQAYKLLHPLPKLVRIGYDGAGTSRSVSCLHDLYTHARAWVRKHENSQAKKHRCLTQLLSHARTDAQTPHPAAVAEEFPRVVVQQHAQIQHQSAGIAAWRLP